MSDDERARYGGLFCPRRRDLLKGGAAAAALFVPLPYAWVRAQSEGVIRLLKAPKVALVLGNNNYKSVPALRNPANDAEGANGLYTEILLKEIRTPETRVEDVFKRVRLNVRRRTRGAQVPWESTSLEEDFWFIPPRQFAPTAEGRARKSSAKLIRTESRVRHPVEAQTKAWADAGPRRVAVAEDQRIAEAEAERKVRAAERKKREQAERENPETEKKFREELARWERIKDSRNADDFYDFLLERPSGYISELAQFRLDQLEAPKVQAQSGADGIKQLPSGVNRFALGDEFGYDIIDGYTNIARRVVGRVTYADSNRAEINGGANVFNQMGGLLYDRWGKKEPAHVGLPTEFTPGKRWRSAFTNTRPDGVAEDVFWDFHVIGLEEVTVPAGTFKAYKVEGEGLARFPGGGTTLSNLRWIDPATMIGLRNDREWRTYRGAMDEYSSSRLVSVRRVPR